MQQPTIDAAGVTMPAIGLGTWRLRGREARDSVRGALDLGYRHIDTAAMYGNESEVGDAIEDSDVERDDIFLVTKIPPSDLHRSGVRRVTESSLKSLRTHIDLLLIHWPNNDVPLEETLDAMQRFKEDGKVRHLGVSNFDVDLLDEARQHAEVVCNQVEMHPWQQRPALLEYAAEQDVIVTAYSPLAKGRVADDQTLREVAEAHDATPAQVALRWLLDKPNVAAIPKAASEEHRRDNLEAVDLDLTDEERERIDALG